MKRLFYIFFVCLVTCRKCQTRETKGSQLLQPLQSPLTQVKVWSMMMVEKRLKFKDHKIGLQLTYELIIVIFLFKPLIYFLHIMLEFIIKPLVCSFGRQTFPSLCQYQFMLISSLVLSLLSCMLKNCFDTI